MKQYCMFHHKILTIQHESALITAFGKKNVSYAYRSLSSFTDGHFVVAVNNPSQITTFLLTDTNGFVCKGKL